jgi:endogenous inhibitor of DNA gyrase (YacG/DUF329 family)
MTDEQKQQIIALRRDGAGYGRIAARLQISINTVKSFCRRQSLSKDTASKLAEILSGEVTHCGNCGAVIYQVKGQKRRKYCSNQCRMAYWGQHLDQVNRKAFYTLKCRHCGKLFQVYGDKGRKYCSRACYLKDRLQGGGHHE